MERRNTLLREYIISKLVYGLRIVILSGASTAFICNSVIAKNKPNKAPGADDGGGGGYAFATTPLNLNSPNLITYNNNIEQNYSQNSLTYATSGPDDSIAYPNAGNPADTDNILERYYHKLLSYQVLQTVRQKENAGAKDFNLFLNYYHDRLFADDRNTFWNMVESGKIKTSTQVQNYAQWEMQQYTQLYKNFLSILKNYPSSVEEYANGPKYPSPPANACNPACDNIDFENGTLSAWSAYYATNTSGNNSFSNTNPVGGACGAVTQSAQDPNTNTYQVSIMSGPGLDPIAGALIPVVCPTGGSYSCRIGDSTRNGAQMGILEQTFTVTQNNANFIYMYAVVLENPSHIYYQQPYFNVQMLDQNGNPIPNCGNYSVVSGPGLPGYKSIYYAKDKDTVYCKPWATVFVPLQQYIGQCITIKVTASDCELGGHFGYAYFDADCSIGVISSSPALCGKKFDTLTAPNGVATYKWSGPCIVGPDTNQKVVVSCAGTYKVVLASVSNSNCSDTLSVVVPKSVPLIIKASSTNILCNGNNTGTANVVVDSGTAPYTYLWSPGGGTNASVSNLSAGTYTVTVKDSVGCTESATVTITQPPVLAATIKGTNVAPCYGDSNGTAKVTVTGGKPGYTYAWVPNGGTNATASNLTPGTYTVNITDANNCTLSASVTITEPPLLTVSISSHHDNGCHGDNKGAAVASASGGTPNYKYLWSNGQTTKSSTSLTSGVYTVTVTDANGCKATDTVVIGEPPQLVITATVISNVLCFGQKNGQASASATGGTSPYSYSWNTSPKQKTQNATGLSAGTYVVTVTDSNGCSNTDSVVITQPVALVATISSSFNVSCNGGNNGSATVSASGGTSPYNYLWSNALTSAAASNLSAGTYTVTVTDSNGCNTTASIAITQPASALAAVISSKSGVSCNGGNNGIATVNASGGTGPYLYLWSNGSTLVMASNLAAGTYTIVVTDTHGCTASATAIITQPAILVAAASSGSGVSCFGGSNGSGTASATGGTLPYKYLWSNGNTLAVANNFSVGTYTVTITDSNGCTSSSSVIITQPTQLVSSISSSSNINCNGGNNGSATVTATGGTTPYKYLWSSGSTLVTASNLTAGTYSVNVTDINGCTASANITITQPAPLAVSLSMQSPSCFGRTNGSSMAMVTGGTGPYTYLWNTSPPQSNQTATGLSAGTYTVTITDSHGCNVNSVLKLTQPPVLIAKIKGITNATCYGYGNGDATVLAGGGTGTYTYSWDTNPIQTNAKATGLSVGTYTVTVTDTNGCSAITSATITQPTKITTKVTGPDSICSGASVNLYASSKGGSGAYLYYWSNGNGPGATITVSPANTTTYTVTAKDNNGCPSDTASITIKTLMLTANAVTMSPPETICQGDSASVFATIDKSNSGNVNISWNINDWKGSGPFKVYPPVTTTYTITVSDQCGNKVIKNVTITVNPLPVIHIADQSGASCKAVTLNFKDTNSANKGYSYYWDFGNNQFSTKSNPSYTYTTSGRYPVTVTVTSLQGCANSAKANMNIQIYPDAAAQFIVNPNSMPVVNPTFAFVDNSQNTTQWYWTFGDGGNAKIKSPTHTYPSVVGDYQVVLYTNNSYGCADSASDSVHVVPDFRIYIPNAFSPNGDGDNEFFTAKGIGIVTFNMMIFDRWGNLLYTTTDINRGWNGTVGGGNRIAQEDTYVYKIQVTDIFKEQHSYLGAVTLIK